MIAKSKVQLTHIHNLIRNAQNIDIQNIKQLCTALFGGKRAARDAFQQIMYWMNYSARSDGSIYKSAKELGHEIGCCEKTVDRAIPLLKEAGLDVYIKKADGAPTRHFIVNVKRMIQRLADIFGFSFEDTCFLMGIDTSETDSDISQQSNQTSVPDATPQDVQVHRNQMSESLTRTKDKKNSTLKRQGFSSFLEKLEMRKWCTELDTKPEMIETWVKEYGYDVVQATIMQARTKQSEGKIKKSMFGWVRATLKAKHTVQRYAF